MRIYQLQEHSDWLIKFLKTYKQRQRNGVVPVIPQLELVEFSDDCFTWHDPVYQLAGLSYEPNIDLENSISMFLSKNFAYFDFGDLLDIADGTENNLLSKESAQNIIQDINDFFGLPADASTEMLSNTLENHVKPWYNLVKEYPQHREELLQKIRDAAYKSNPKILNEHNDKILNLLKQIKISEKTGQNTVPPYLSQFFAICEPNFVRFEIFNKKFKELYKIEKWIVEIGFATIDVLTYSQVYGMWKPKSIEFKAIYKPIDVDAVKNYWNPANYWLNEDLYRDADNSLWIRSENADVIAGQLKPWIQYMCDPAAHKILNDAALRQAKKINWPYL